MRAAAIGVLALSLCVCQKSSAQDDAGDKRGAYLGLSMGLLNYSDSTGIGRIEENTLLTKIYGGFRFGKRWSVEASYGRAQDFETTEETRFFFASPEIFTLRDFEILEVRGLAHFGSFYAGVGVWRLDSTMTRYVPSSTFGPYTYDRSDSGSSVILGGEWDFDRFSLRTEIERYDDTWTLGIGFQDDFGGSGRR